MTSTAAVRLSVLAGLATWSCWSGATVPREAPVEGRGPRVGAPRQVGPYWCSIRDGEFEYPRMPCAIRDAGGVLVLVKLGGSQRFRGTLQPLGRGFSFDGELYCPWGDCAKPLRGEFAPIARDAWRGTFEDDSMEVTLVRAPDDSAWGGASYGGDSYGGWGAGGATPPYPRGRH